MAANLLTNPGFEAGQTGWNGVVRGSVAVVVTNPAAAHSGNNYISNYNAGGWSSASQGDSLGGWSTGVSLPVSDAKFYKLGAWVKVPGAATTPADITLRYRFEPSAARVDVGQQTISTEDWTLLESAWIRPNVGDTFIGYWEVHSVANAVVFYADDCSLEESVGYAINGVVKDEVGAPVVGALVQLKQASTVLRTTTSTAGGAYTFYVQPIAGESYDLNATKINYQSPDSDVNVLSALAGVTAADVIITNIPLVTLSGVVTDATTSLAITGATVTVLTPSGSSLTTTTGVGGTYSILVESNGTFAVKADKFPLSAAWQVFPNVSSDFTADFSLGNSLLVGVYAHGMTAGSVATWTNKGSLGGKFVPLLAGVPVAGQNGIYNAVKFNSSPMILSNETAGALIAAPAEITGATANYTVSAWLYDANPTLPDQQTYISWAQRGGPDGSNCEMGYGANAAFGAAGHWGAPDMGFTTPPTVGAWHNVVVTWNSATGIESLYIDGVLSKNSPVKSLSIGAGFPIVLGSGYWNGATTRDADILFTAFMARVEIYSAAVSASDVPLLATNTPPVLAVGSIAGKVVTTDGSVPSGFTVTVTGGTGIAGTATTGAGGTYSFSVAAPANYTVKAVKANYVTMPAPQAAATTIGNTTTVGDFTASPSSLVGVLVDATTGAPINNGIVQVGGKGGQAVVTGTNGTFSLGGVGNGGVELFADALGYQCTNLLFTATGTLYKKVALVPQVETGVVTNGGFEDSVGGLPTSWIQIQGDPWDPTAPLPITQFWATNVPASGTNSVFVTGATAFEPLSQYIPADPSSVYNCYFKAVGTNMTTAGTVWFPMFAFRNGTFGEVKGWISGEPAPYMWWSHNAPENWMQYLLFQTYSGDAIQPFVRIAPPAGAVWLSATFCFTGATALPSDQGVFVDDLVMDKVPASVPLVATTPDPVLVSIESVGGSVKLTWPIGTLLESTSVTGPWTTNSATSPYTVSPVGNKFYKVIVQ